MRVARRPSLVPLVAVLALIVPQRASAIKLFVDSVECMSKRVDFEGDAVTGSFVGVPGSNIWSRVGRKTSFNLEVTDESGSVVHAIYDKEDSDFSFHTTKPGRLTFCLRSLSPGIKEVLWELHVGHVITHEKALAEHVDEVSEVISQLKEQLEEVLQRTHYYRNRDEVHLMTMKSTDLRVVLTALLEAFFLVAVTAFQIFVIRRMFDRKVANVLR